MSTHPVLPSPPSPADDRPGVIGYTAGVFDLFHIGHLNLLRAARERCDFLVVGVTTDTAALRSKGQAPVIPLLERLAIVQSVRYVDHVIPQETPDKLEAWQVVQFDVLFAGDNVRPTGRWAGVDEDMARVGAQVVYLPTTHATTGELLNRGLDDVLSE